MFQQTTYLFFFFFFLILPRKHDFTFHANFLITKTRLYNFDPLKPHFYIVKLEFIGGNIIFLISDHWMLVLVRTASSKRFYRVPTIYVLNRSKKNIWFFLSEKFSFLVVKFSIYLNRRVFVMSNEDSDAGPNYKIYVRFAYIMKTRLLKILQPTILIFFISLLKTKIVGTR